MIKFCILCVKELVFYTEIRRDAFSWVIITIIAIQATETIDATDV